MKSIEEVVAGLKGHSPSHVARETGLHRNTTREIMNGKRDNISLSTLRKLIEYLEGTENAGR